jgi:hypothetical protein
MVRDKEKQDESQKVLSLDEVEELRKKALRRLILLSAARGTETTDFGAQSGQLIWRVL